MAREGLLPIIVLSSGRNSQELTSMNVSWSSQQPRRLESLGRSSQWLPRQGTAGRKILLSNWSQNTTTNEYLEAPKERSNRPLLRSIANDGDAPKERTRRGQWYVLHDRLTEFQFRPLRVLSLGASPTTAMLLRRGQIVLSLGACRGRRRGS